MRWSTNKMYCTLHVTNSLAYQQNRHYSVQVFSSVVGTINQHIFIYKYTKFLVIR